MSIKGCIQMKYEQVARVPRLLHRRGFSNNKNKSASGDGRQAQAGPGRPKQA